MKKFLSIIALSIFLQPIVLADDVVTTGNCRVESQGDTVYLISRDYHAGKVSRRSQVIVSSSLLVDGVTFAGDTRFFQGKGFKSKYKRFFKNSPVESSEQGDYSTSFTLPARFFNGADHAMLITKIEEESCCRVKTRYDSCLVELPKPVVVLETKPTLITLSVAEKLQPQHQLLHPMDEYVPFSDTVPVHRDKHALLVYFPLDKYNLDYTYKQNRETLDTIVKIIRDIYNDDRSDVKVIQIVGFASVEGNSKHNIELAGNRARVLKEFINERVKQPDYVFEVANGGEAWLQMRDAIVELDKPWKDEVLNIIDNEKDLDRREQKIKAFQGGAPYAHIKKYLLENQRHSGYIRVYFNAKPDSAGLAVNNAVKQINAGTANYREIYDTVSKFADDERTYNILGVACYNLGRMDEAKAYFKKAADNGDVQAAANYENINKTTK